MPVVMGWLEDRGARSRADRAGGHGSADRWPITGPWRVALRSKERTIDGDRE
jgi:hypothetical protein